jgi:hypothetical protein
MRAASPTVHAQRETANNPEYYPYLKDGLRGCQIARDIGSPGSKCAEINVSQDAERDEADEQRKPKHREPEVHRS